MCQDVHDFTGFTTEPIKGVVKEIVYMAKGVGERLQHTDLGETQALMDTASEEGTEDNLMDVLLNQRQALRKKKKQRRKTTDASQLGRRLSQDCF